jgi:hypothetical protein
LPIQNGIFGYNGFIIHVWGYGIWQNGSQNAIF